MLWQTVFRLLNHREDTLDCCQQVLLEAYEYTKDHQVDEWGAFLRTMATRRAIDGIRKKASAQYAPCSLQDMAEPITHVDCPVARAEATELMDRLRVALAHLPQHQAEAFWLSCIEDLSHDEISRECWFTGHVSALRHF